MNGPLHLRWTTRGRVARRPRFVLIAGLASVVATLWIVGSAQGKGPSSVLKVQGAEFDPQRQCDAKAAWVKGVGLFADNDAFAYGFLMKKLCSTAGNVPARTSSQYRSAALRPASKSSA